MADNFKEEDYVEYETFMETTSKGEEVEMAIVDRFVFEEKHYVVAALVKGDEISDDGLFVYRSSMIDGELVIKKIEDADEYSRIAEYYASLEQ